jgi:hypothetical protein
MSTIKEVKMLKELGVEISAVIFGDLDAWRIDFIMHGNHSALFTSKGTPRIFNKFETALLTAREITQTVTVNLDPNY